MRRSSSSNSDLNSSVRVAVRARPLIPLELLNGARPCIRTDESAACVTLGHDRRFTFDHAFGVHATQEQVYEACVAPLVEGLFEGLNATVLAYGQTTSGKTYTTGMAPIPAALLVSSEAAHSQEGITSRAIRHLFGGISLRQSNAVFKVRAQFLEIYNEEVYDLLLQDDAQPKAINIRESSDGRICVTGACEVEAGSLEELLAVLEQGVRVRATGSTATNDQSSRSHALLTITLEQHIGEAATHGLRRRSASRDDGLGSTGCADPEAHPVGGQGSVEVCSAAVCTEIRRAKLHLVDLAGSERTKKSRSSGQRFREAVTINQGLHALSNVVSALGDERRRCGHVPYRDSKLTRLLQDSLGGNSRTTLIACVSCADDSLEETLNTLKYAHRARNICNKPVAHRQV
ncbi:MAG: hypothetical protein WDW36_006094 [Sanguina aurantia]